MKNRKVRYFIIPPSPYFEDNLWILASTTSRRSFDDIYQNDWFVDEYTSMSKEDVMRKAKGTGCKMIMILGERMMKVSVKPRKPIPIGGTVTVKFATMESAKAFAIILKKVKDDDDYVVSQRRLCEMREVEVS